MARKSKKISRRKTYQYDGTATTLRSMGHPIRLQILERLSKKEMSVKSMASALNVSQPNLSQHLAILRGAGLIESRAKGALRYYYLSKPAMIKGMLKLLSKKR
jgi:ArsR family transcriptional regulator